MTGLQSPLQRGVAYILQPKINEINSLFLRCIGLKLKERSEAGYLLHAFIHIIQYRRINIHGVFSNAASIKPNEVVKP